MVNVLAPETSVRVTITAGIVISARKDGTISSATCEGHLCKEHSKNIIKNMRYARRHVCMHVRLDLIVKFTNT